MIRWLKWIGFAALMCLVTVMIWCLCLLDAIFRFRFAFPRDIFALREQRGWCVEQLRASGGLPEDAVLLSYDVAPFKEKESLRSELAVVEISYRRPDEADDALHHFRCLAKCAPQQGSLWNRTIYVLQGNCTKEVGFYRELAASVPGLVPRCYFAGVSEGTGHFCLLLSLLEDVDEFSEEEGCPVEAGHRVMESLARLHGAFWGHVPGTQHWLSAIPDVFVDFFLVLFGRQLDAAYGYRSRDIWRRCNAPQTVLHGDARVGNMLFRRSGDGEESDLAPVVLFDWQATRLGLGVCDVAYFLVLSVETDVRVAHEEALLRTYHKGLNDAGVTGYDWASLREDYRHACLLLGQMFGLPFLSSEISVDDEESKRRALSGGLTWSRRGHAFIEQMDEVWLRETYGIERDVLLHHTEASLLTPHPMNHGALLVAGYLREHGGIKALYQPFE